MTWSRFRPLRAGLRRQARNDDRGREGRHRDRSDGAAAAGRAADGRRGLALCGAGAGLRGGRVAVDRRVFYAVSDRRAARLPGLPTATDPECCECPAQPRVLDLVRGPVPVLPVARDRAAAHRGARHRPRHDAYHGGDASDGDRGGEHRRPADGRHLRRPDRREGTPMFSASCRCWPVCSRCWWSRRTGRCSRRSRCTASPMAGCSRSLRPPWPSSSAPAPTARSSGGSCSSAPSAPPSDPSLAGRIFDVTGSYEYAFTGLAVMGAIGLALGNFVAASRAGAARSFLSGVSSPYTNGFRR